MDLDYSRFEVVTFDCYGTLIDWEAGILAALRAALWPGDRGSPGDGGPAGDDGRGDDELLELYAGFEAAAEAGPWRSYRAILESCVTQVGARYGIKPDEARVAAFGDSVGDWPAFPDSAAALARLQSRFRLGVLTNCDDDLFARSASRLGIGFDWVVTAEQVGSYKPNPRHFEVGFERIDAPHDRILHVAQSLFHDHATAKRIGLTTAWINRRHDRVGSGATPTAEAAPDATFPDMASFAAAATRM